MDPDKLRKVRYYCRDENGLKTNRTVHGKGLFECIRKRARPQETGGLDWSASSRHRTVNPRTWTCKINILFRYFDTGSRKILTISFIAVDDLLRFHCKNTYLSANEINKSVTLHGIEQ